MTVTKKLITVFGGTGNQGTSVVRSLLAHKDQLFQVRVITRDPESSKAQELAKLGAEIVLAEGSDRSQTTAAFKGSWGAFINSNSDGPNDEDSIEKPTPYDLDVAVLDAAEAAGVQHIVYSSAASPHRATKGRINLTGFDYKTYAEEYARSEKSFTTFTAVLPASFMECWTQECFCQIWGGFPWYRNGQKEVVLAVPPYGGDGRMPWISVQDDLGDIVHGIFLNPQRYDQKQVQAISQLIKLEDMAKELTKGELLLRTIPWPSSKGYPHVVHESYKEHVATGTPVRYQQLASWRDVPHDGSHLREEARLMFFFMNFCGGKWFAEHASDDTAARECKQAAVEARGCSTGNLTTFKEWFTRESANHV
ncbi:hypothetical protein AOCH_000471 [Aspergillus ochraceoroseus]|uniref:NmrA-like domain-containing protein n=1 Tax=Aspergillus ochraceoroseus TaxID=138278 RepID=A0A0F8UQ00_9EURO|nr:hypothetical protein AOCH_000471 [Aspergillus ochraceoroseus]